MTARDPFRREQAGVAVGMMAALSITMLTCAIWTMGNAQPRALADRVTAAAMADLVVVPWLAIMIGNIARRRFFSARDIGGSGSGEASPEVRRAGAVLQNTLEQMALAIPTHLALAIVVPASVPLIVALAALFSLGRLLFWIGYAKGAAARAFGFALTFYPTVAGLGIAIAAALRMPL